jgi:hypothetical protein
MMMKRKLKITPFIVLGLFLSLILFGSAAFVSAQQTTPTPTAAARTTPTLTDAPEIEPAIKVIIQETYIQGRLEKEMELNPAYSDPEIDFRAPDLALISFTTRVNTFLKLRPTATVQFSVEDEEVVVEVIRIDVNGMSVPRSLIESQIDELREEIQLELNNLTGSLTEADLELVEISATEDALVVSLEPLEEEELDDN